MELSEELGCFPLALEQAASYIVASKNTVANYIKQWKKHELRILKMQPKGTVYERTVLTIWKTTFDQIEEEAGKDEITKAAMQLFRLCTYCSPDNIPLQMFIEGRDEIPQPLSNVLDPENELGHFD